MFYLYTIEQVFLFVEQLDQLQVCLPYSRLLTGILILAVFQNLRWNSNKTSLLKYDQRKTEKYFAGKKFDNTFVIYPAIKISWWLFNNPNISHCRYNYSQLRKISHNISCCFFKPSRMVPDILLIWLKIWHIPHSRFSN